MANKRVMCVCVVACSLSGQVMAGQEFLVAGGSSNQGRPSISGLTVVWHETKSSDNWDVFGADLTNPASPKKFTVAADPLVLELNPYISGNTVVYEYESDLWENDAIYLADITRRDRPELSGLVSVNAPQKDNLPVISGNVVAWQDLVGGDWDVRACGLGGKSPELLRLPMTYNDESGPALEGSLLFWHWSSNGSSFVTGCDVFDPNAKALPLFSPDANQFFPALSGRYCVCATDRGVESDNLSDPFLARQLCDQPVQVDQPAICQNVVVWTQKYGSQWDIVGYNIAKRTRFKVTDNASDQTEPAVSFSPELKAYVVVWSDRRSGNWDIYGRVLDPKDQVGGCASPLKGDLNEDCTVNSLDVAEVQSRIGQTNGVAPN